MTMMIRAKLMFDFGVQICLNMHVRSDWELTGKRGEIANYARRDLETSET